MQRGGLHCSEAEELLGRHTVGWDVPMGWGNASLPQIFTGGRVEHFQSSSIGFALSTSHHGTLSDGTHTGQGRPVGCRQAPQSVHHGVFGDLCRLFKKLPQQCWYSPKVLSVIFLLIPSSSEWLQALEHDEALLSQQTHQETLRSFKPL